MSNVVTTTTNTIVIEPDPSTIVHTDSPSSSLISSTIGDLVVMYSSNASTISENTSSNAIIMSGIPGPAGPAGPAGQSEEDMQYAKRLDSVSSTEMYKGEAAVGSLTTSALWRIQKIIFGSDGDVTITWADGNANFDNIWDNRLSLSYS